MDIRQFRPKFVAIANDRGCLQNETLEDAVFEDAALEDAVTGLTKNDPHPIETRGVLFGVGVMMPARG
ncbi:hypothetical protein JQ604_40205 [Bradyrhizobium jicamae]|uniref:hypothetical protein n=1 Tax=Bradyrhizobium jicamae TaxID=280332 RepID=UPI001BACC05C|nr:hypothetical protein [Bradyrhizobium jicamae]MBR0758440.1 hypothetical protein [Bradyrhizobium jicamae]